MATEKVLKIKVDAETKKALRGMKTLQTQTAKSTAGFKKMGGTIAKFVGAALVLKAFKDITKAAIRQENSIKGLNTALKLTGESFTKTKGGIDAMSANLQQVAADIQKVTTVGDEASMEVMQLGLSMGIQASKIGEATKQAIGLSKAYKMDLNASIKMVALAHKGDFNMLQRYIPALKLAKTAAEKKAIALKAMAGGYEIAKAEAETFGGKLTQLGNTFGDFKERLGAAVTQNESFGRALDGLKKTLEDPAITDGIGAIISGITTMASQLVNVIGLLGKGASALQKFAGNVGTSFADAIMGKNTEDAIDGVEAQFNDLLVTVMKTRREFGKNAEGFANFDRVLVALRNSTGTYEEKMVRLQKIIRSTAESNGAFKETYKETRKEIKKNVEETDKLIVAKEEETTVTGKATGANEKAGKEIKTETVLYESYNTQLQNAIIMHNSLLPGLGSLIGNMHKLGLEFQGRIIDIQKILPFMADMETQTEDNAEATNFWETSLGNLIITTQSVFSSLSRLGGGLGNLAGHLETVTADVGNLIGGLGGKKFGLKDIPNAINLGVSAFQLLGPAISAVGSAIGSFFDMWGDSEWKKLLRSTDDETEAIWDMINTLGMTPGVIDTIKNRLDTLPAGFEATRRGLEQLLIDAGAAEAGMRGLAGRPELEADAGSFKHQTDTPTFDKNYYNPDGGFMSAANGFNGVLKRDTLIQAHAKEGVSITPKGQMGSGSSGGGDKVDARRYNFDNTFQFNLTEKAILNIVANGFRKNREQLNRTAKKSMGIR